MSFLLSPISFRFSSLGVLYEVDREIGMDTFAFMILVRINFILFFLTDDTVSADIKLETETEDGGEAIPTTLSPNTYHPRRALRNAITEWLTEFSRVKSAWGPIAKPQPVVAAAVPVPIIPSINTCMSLTTATTTTCTSSAGGNTTSITSLPVVNTTQLHALAEVCSNVSYSLFNVSQIFKGLVHCRTKSS